VDLRGVRLTERRTLEREVLFDLTNDRGRLLSLTFSVIAFAIGHATMALAAGAIAQGLAQTAPEHPFSRLPSFAFAWRGSLAALSYFGLGSALVKATAGASLARAETSLAAAVAGRLRVELVSGLLREGQSVLPAPRVLSALAVRLREVETSVTRGVVTFGRAAVQLVPLSVCLVLLSPVLTLVALGSAVPFGVTIAILRGRSRRANERAQSEMEALDCGVDELVRNADLFRTYGAGANIVTAVAKAGERAGLSAARVESVRAALSGGNEVMAALAVAGAIAAAERFGVVSRASVLLPFAAVFFMAYRPLRDLGDARGFVLRGTVALDAVRRAISVPITRTASALVAPARVAAQTALSLDLRALGASDRGPTTTMRAASGSIVCIVGPTGSGKTTLFRVLLGLERARGQLWLDGKDVTHVPTGPASRPFAWVPQDAPLVTGTVEDNVLLTGGDAAAAREALELVGGERLLDAADDLVGPAGRPLSGGERRLIALARALASGLPVLLLDEPTEGLDADAASSVRDAIVRLRGIRTVLVATHRQDVLDLADQVVTLGSKDDAVLAAE
jgi:ABC-type multidrug transport system fused ATPase/permease subunit